MHRTTRIAARFSERCILLIASVSVMVGCSSNRVYDTAFSSKTALSDNSHVYSASAGTVFNAVKLSLVQQGFEIDQLNSADGLLKGMRTFDDPKNPKIAYLVTLTAEVSASSRESTVLTAAATQKTVLNREIHKYYHLLGLLPIPTGREHQSVVRAEGPAPEAASPNGVMCGPMCQVYDSHNNSRQNNQSRSPKGIGYKQ